MILLCHSQQHGITQITGTLSIKKIILTYNIIIRTKKLYLTGYYRKSVILVIRKKMVKSTNQRPTPATCITINNDSK